MGSGGELLALSGDTERLARGRRRIRGVGVGWWGQFGSLGFQGAGAEELEPGRVGYYLLGLWQ